MDLSIATNNIILGFGKNRVKRLMGNGPSKEGLFGNLRANPQNNKLFWILIYSLMSKAANQSVTHMFFYTSIHRFIKTNHLLWYMVKKLFNAIKQLLLLNTTSINLQKVSPKLSNI